MRSTGYSIALSLFGLAGPACGGLKASDFDGSRPRIEQVRLAGQSQTDPYALRFTITFSVKHGTLELGFLHLLINDHETTTQSLAGIFQAQAPPFDPTATRGDLAVIVRVDERTIKVGERFTVGFFLLNAKGEKSNVASVVLEVSNPRGRS